MGKWSSFNDKVDLSALKTEAEEIKKNGGTGEIEETPAGLYRAACEKLEVRETKDGRPMLNAMFRIKYALDDENNEAAKEYMTHFKNKGPCVFMNRVLFGTKNDANMIASAEGWLESLEPSEDIDVVFIDYDQFADMVLDVAEDIAELEYDISYDPDAFNSIHIEDVYE